MDQTEESRWINAEKYLESIEKAYEEIGLAGTYALALTVKPLKKRYQGGERSEALYKEIMSLE